jgi:hypothetical protein
LTFPAARRAKPLSGPAFGRRGPLGGGARADERRIRAIFFSFKANVATAKYKFPEIPPRGATLFLSPLPKNLLFLRLIAAPIRALPPEPSARGGKLAERPKLTGTSGRRADLKGAPLVRATAALFGPRPHKAPRAEAFPARPRAYPPDPARRWRKDALSAPSPSPPLPGRAANRARPGESSKILRPSPLRIGRFPRAKNSGEPVPLSRRARPFLEMAGPSSARAKSYP